MGHRIVGRDGNHGNRRLRTTIAGGGPITIKNHRVVTSSILNRHLVNDPPVSEQVGSVAVMENPTNSIP